MKKLKCISKSARPLRVMGGVGYVATGDIIRVADDVAESLVESGDFEPAKETTKKKKETER